MDTDKNKSSWGKSYYRLKRILALNISVWIYIYVSNSANRAQIWESFHLNILQNCAVKYIYWLRWTVPYVYNIHFYIRINFRSVTFYGETLQKLHSEKAWFKIFLQFLMFQVKSWKCPFIMRNMRKFAASFLVHMYTT